MSELLRLTAPSPSHPSEVAEDFVHLAEGLCQIRKAVRFSGHRENEWMLLTVPVHPERKT